VRNVSARRALPDFAPPSELSFRAGPGPSSPGSVRFFLSTDVGSRVHSRVPSRGPFGRITTMCPVPFRLRGFSPPWRLPPLELRGLVSSRCRSEVHRVSASASLAVGSGPPHGAARTLRRMPLVDSRAASPQPLPSCRLRRSTSLLSLHRSWCDRSLHSRSSGRRSFVRGLGRLPSFLRSSPSPGLPDVVALPPSLRSTFGPREALTPMLFLREGGRAGVPLRRGDVCRGRSSCDGCVAG